MDPEATTLPPALRAGPTRLALETSSRCNLKCAMCPKQSAGAACEEGDFPFELFSALEPALPGLESLVLNGIGEPLLHPRLEEIVRAARRLMPASASVGFQTNGTLLDRARAESLLEAGVDRVCVSLDAADPELLGRIRAGGSLSAVARALAALREAAEGAGRAGSLGRPPLRLGLEFVVMRDNLGELPKVIEWAAGRGLSFIIASQLFPYDQSILPLAAWDPNLDLAIELRRRYRARARARGLELDDYRRVFMKYEKSPEELAVTGLVAEMQAEAEALGLTINVERLLSGDERLLEAAGEAFARSAEAAAREGIELLLPGAAPKKARSCEFVEGGSAFVSWDGQVHPCYFLWHRYACYVGGIEKLVEPKRFGSLRDRDLLAIWKDPAFAAFRRAVLRYEYPYCYNCNLALCDYVQRGDFEQDCHINAEPCAACLWCQGLFRCMV